MTHATPEHHPPDELLFEYATGACTPAVGLFAACHLTLCPVCRTRVAELESLGAALLDEVEAIELSGGARDALLARLDEPEPSPTVGDGVLPKPLFDLVGPAAELPWSRVFPGLERIDLPLTQQELPARLYRFAPRLKLPTHSHAGVERTLVLTGGYTDAFGHHERGDASVLQGGFDHDVLIDPLAPCIALAVNDLPFDASRPLGRILQWYLQA